MVEQIQELLFSNETGTKNAQKIAREMMKKIKKSMKIDYYN